MLLLVKLETADKVTWASFVIIEETNSVELLDTFTCASSISKDDTSIDETAVRLHLDLYLIPVKPEQH
jgi:hypothetical protein